MGHTPVCQLVFAIILKCQMAQTGPTAARKRLDMRPQLELGPDKHGATARDWALIDTGPRLGLGPDRHGAMARTEP